MQDGWLLLTTQANELPVQLLSKVTVTSLPKTMVGWAPKVFAQSGATSVSTVSTTKAESIPVVTSITATKSVYSGTASLSMSSLLRTIVSSSAIAVATSRQLVTQANSSNYTSVCAAVKKFATSGELDTKISSPIRTILSSSSDVARITNTKTYVTGEVGVNIAHAVPTVVSAQTDVSFSHLIQSIATSGYLAAPISLVKKYAESGLTSIVIPVKEYIVSGESDIKISAPAKVYTASSYIEGSIVRARTIVDSDYVQACITATKLKAASGDTPIEVGIAIMDRAISGDLPIDIVKVISKYIVSSSLPLDYDLAQKKYWSTGPLPITVNGARKLWFTSGNTLIDVFGDTRALLLDEQEWIIIKKLGTQSWKFLAGMDDKTTTVLAHIGAKIRLQETIDAAENADIIFTSFGEVERITWYRDQTKQNIMMEVYIEYTNQFPFRSTTVYYDWFNIRCHETIQTYAQSLNGTIIPDTFTSNSLFVPNSSVLLTCNTIVQEGMAVYVDGSGILQPAIATSKLTSNVIGLVQSKPNSHQARIAQVGELGISSLTLTPGNKVFLSATVPGALSPTVITTPNHILRRIGYATGVHTVLIDIQNISVIRH